ncbi:hypothetical protein [Vibrio mytili]|uniref:hypothetical protein n=1 Tax=Vibrio mytili TaxID=50718 RepID=UPI000A917768|nr:hypothetical protein [Vibrio mytili]
MIKPTLGKALVFSIPSFVIYLKNLINKKQTVALQRFVLLSDALSSTGADCQSKLAQSTKMTVL